MCQKNGVAAVRLCLALAILLGTGAVAAPVTTHHSIVVAGRKLAYTAEAGFVPLMAEGSGAIHGDIFYAAYRTKGKERPLAFVWNGGPGAPANFVQFQGFGPRLLQTDGRFADNQDSLLPAADLVFVDPVGTGYSRPASVEYTKEYFGTVEDAKATTQFIQTWIKQHHAEKRPLYLIGESFGVYRAGGVAERLESQGRHLTGLVFISGGVASGPLIPPTVRAALVTPQRTGAALALGKLDADLRADRGEAIKQATQWALEDYLPALKHIARLSDAERDAVAASLSRFTGYPLEQIDRKTLAIGNRDYLTALSPDPGKPLATLDMRVTEIPTPDPALVDGYFHHALGVHTDRAYWAEPASPDDPLHAGGKRWINDYRWPESEKFGRDYAEPWLQHALAINPGIKVWVAAGLYDSLNSCAENNVLRAMLEPDLARNYTMRCYIGGHMMYRDPDARSVLTKDIRTFIANTIPRR